MWSWLWKDIKGEVTVAAQEIADCYDIEAEYNLLVSKGLPVIRVTSWGDRLVYIGIRKGYVVATMRDYRNHTTVYYWEKM